MDRRTFVGGTMAGAAALSSGAARAFGGASADDAVVAVLDRVYAERIADSPELATNLGLDSGAGAGLRAKLDDRSPAGIARGHAITRAGLRDLQKIDRASLSAAGRINYDTFVGPWSLQIEAIDRFKYGTHGWPEPYSVSQLSGCYRTVPDFLATQHPVATKADAEAYLSRLNDFAGQIDAETARVRREHGIGVVPPAFIIDKAVTQFDAALATAPERASMVTALADKAKTAGVAGDWGAQAAKIVRERVMPALRRQREVLVSARAGAPGEAGVWRLPDGPDYYRYATQYATTTTMSADDIHRLGLDQMAELSARADEILKSQGLTQGGVGARLTALGKRPDQLYPNTDAGRQQLLADLNRQNAAMEALLPRYFGRLPKAEVEIRRVPPETEAGSAGGYYQGPALDGSRPGAFYINLRDTAEWPRFSLPTLVYHESLPGHHLQIALGREATGIPELRKVTVYSAYAEGWGLYAEALADEMGVYESDPLGRLGYLQSFMFRAARLVVDTGLHHKRWSREQAIRYMVEATGQPETAMTTEVERYCVWPGQATSYKVGQTRWLALREEARAKLGDRFDIKAFHDVALAASGVPLSALENVVREWMASRSA